MPYQFWMTVVLALCCSVTGWATDELDWLDQYNIVWTTQSRNSGESMPVGGGDVCMNVWVEAGDVLFYIQRPGAYDENGACLKAGRIRVRLEPNPFANDTPFRQELKLRDGCVEISGGKSGAIRLRLWADVRQPVVHLDIAGDKPLAVKAWYESWRTTPYQAHDFTWYDKPGTRPQTVADGVKVGASDIRFWHRNPEQGLFDAMVTMQGMDAVKAQLWNPLKNLTSGGVLQGDGFAPVPGEPTKGTYAGTAYRGWALASTEERTEHALRLVLHTAQSATLEDWQAELQARIEEANATTKQTAWSRTHDWWKDFWNRSRIVIHANPASAHPEDSAAWQVGRNYQLFRYMLGCNAYGDAPSKFNGGFFTFDPAHINFMKTGTGGGSPDSRAWGGSNHTGQNQRLVYWPMLKSGDGDMMRPQLDFYARMKGNGELRSKVYWGHGGMNVLDQTESFGLPSGVTYGWTADKRTRPADLEPGLPQVTLHQHYYTSQIEFAWMMLERYRYTGTDITEYIPYIESVLTFFDEHYQYRCRQRTGKPLDEHGKLVIEPSKALETYADCTNPTDVITGLTVTLKGLLDLPVTVIPESRKAHWRDMLSRMPAPVYFASVNGKRLIIPAEKYGRRCNGEIPQLYPLFPYGTYGIGKPDLDDALNCWNLGGPGVFNEKGYISWFQSGIFCARMGLTDEARYYAIAKLSDSGRRFPAFWGPGFDYAPDHNWGGSGMIGLQDMLLQDAGDDLYLLPAWPKDWDVDFKLHAPFGTTVEGRFADDELKDVKLTGRKQWILHRPQASVPIPQLQPQLPKGFASITTPLDKQPNRPGIWQRAVFDAQPQIGNGIYSTAPESLMSFDCGQRMRGIVKIRLRADSTSAASGIIEISNNDVNANRFAEKASFRGIQVGLNGKSMVEYYTLGGNDQWNDMSPEWRPVGAGRPLPNDWVEITIDTTQEGFVTISVRDMAGTVIESSRVKAVEFVNGFRFIRLGNYRHEGGPVQFTDLQVIPADDRVRPTAR